MLEAYKEMGKSQQLKKVWSLNPQRAVQEYLQKSLLKWIKKCKSLNPTPNLLNIISRGATQASAPWVILTEFKFLESSAYISLKSYYFLNN